MKKIALLIVIAVSTFSCNSVKNLNTSDAVQAATLLGSLSSNSTVQQVTSLFSLLDTNSDNAISSNEAIGSVSDNFNVLDTDNNSSLNLSEFTGLLKLL